MPYLMVNLDDPADCQRGLQTLKRSLGLGPGAEVAGKMGPGCGPGRHRRQRMEGVGQHRGIGAPESAECGPGPKGETELPLRKKLERIRHRRIWDHLVRIAVEVNEPKSLPEIDALLDLPKNKMRSLKAIMGKLEHRWGIRFLRTEPDGGVDESGNPRYIMPPHVRKQIVAMNQQAE